MNIRQRSILVVDDDALNRKLEEALLRADGFDVRSVESGQQALAAIATAPPDLILLDLMMPVLDGFAVLSEVKADAVLRDIPVIIVSAEHDSKSVVKGIKQGADDYITKPIDAEHLKSKLKDHLG